MKERYRSIRRRIRGGMLYCVDISAESHRNEPAPELLRRFKLSPAE